MTIKQTEYHVKNEITGEYEAIHFITDANIVKVNNEKKHYKGSNVEAIFEEVGEALATTTKQVEAQVIQKKYNIKNKKYTPIVTFIDDDGSIGVYTKMFPLFQEKGIKGVSAIVPNLLNTAGKMTTDQVKELYNAGWEIASHSHSHINFSTLTNEQVDNECKLSKESIENMGFECNNLIYPGGSFLTSQFDNISQYFKCAATASGGVNKGAVRTYELTRTPLGSYYEQGTLAEYKTAVDEAVANNGWVIFMTHASDPNHDDIQQQHLSDLIDYIKSLSVPILTLDEGYEIRGNVLEMGYMGLPNHFIVAPNAEIYTDGIRDNVYTLGNNGYTANTVPTGFPKGVSTITFVYSDNSGFPDGGGGTLITYNQILGTEFQIFHIEDKIYKRTWNVSEWSEFKRVNSMIKVSENNAYDGNSLLGSFESKCITYTRVFGSANLCTLPESSPGTLITNRLVVAVGYDFQQYKIYDSNKIYRRYWTEAGVWSEWQLESAMLKTSIAADFGSVGANSIKQLSFNVAGATNADQIICSPTSSIDLNILWFASISGTGTVNIKVYNPTTSAISVSRTFKVTIIKQ